MDDLEDPNVAARTEMLRAVRERTFEPSPRRSWRSMTLGMRLVCGAASAVFVAAWLFVVTFPATSFAPYWWLVGLAFVFGAVFGHLIPSGQR